jgi:hypothetical protein
MRPSTSTQELAMTLAAARRFLAVLAVLISVPVHAQVFRAYLSLNGNDANPCTLQQPCRLLPAALAAVMNGGEIWMLDSANYNTGPVSVTQSVTILAVPGVVGSVVATSGANAMEISGGSVVLRNLVFVPLPGAAANDGVLVTGNTALLVDHCLFSNLPGNGIEVTSAANLRVIDSVFHGNGAGVRAQGGPTGSTSTIDIAGSSFDGQGGQGLALFTISACTVKGALRDSRIVQNALGVDIITSSGSTVTLSVTNTLVSDNGSIGLRAFNPGAKLYVTGSTISGNGNGIVAAGGGVVESAGNNAVRNNGVDMVGTVTVVGTN